MNWKGLLAVWVFVLPMSAGADAGPQGAPTSAPYLVNCDSMFAARIVELQVGRDSSFPLDCSVPLRAAVGALGGGGTLCRVGESANACRQRLYDSPPPVTSLGQPCSGAGCLRGVWLPPCGDGTHDCAAPEAICPDGTRPMIYVEAARSGPSNRWLFYTTGTGNPCSGEGCWTTYRYAALNNDPAHAAALSGLHPDHPTQGSRLGTGITQGAPGNALAGFNRVEFKRCGESASNGMERVPVMDGVPTSLAPSYPSSAPRETRRSTVDAWHHGFQIYRAAFHALSTAAGRDLNGDGVPDVPSLAAATTVLLAGSSDAAGYLPHAGDRLAEELRLVAGSSVDVRLVLDGRFEPALDSEGRYSPGAPAGFNLLDHPYHVTGLCGPLPDNGDGRANETCSDSHWLPGPRADGGPSWFDGFAARGSLRDSSCLQAHGDDAPCANDFHTLVHHASVPILIIADQEDPVVAKGVALDDTGGYSWPQLSHYRERVLAQARDVQALWATRREETPTGGVAMVLRKQRRNSEPTNRANHTHLDSNDKTHRWKMTRCGSAGAVASLTIADVIARWVDGNLSAAEQFIVEDASRSGIQYWVTGDTCRAPE